jgi:hypothetical protein
MNLLNQDQLEERVAKLLLCNIGEMIRKTIRDEYGGVYNKKRLFSLFKSIMKRCTERIERASSFDTIRRNNLLKALEEGKLKSAIKEAKRNSDLLTYIHDRIVFHFKELLYSSFFGEEKLIGLRKRVIIKTMEDLEKKGIPVNKERWSTFWSHYKEKGSIKDEEVEVDFVSIINPKNFKYLIMRRYSEGYPVFVPRNIWPKGKRIISKDVREVLNAIAVKYRDEENFGLYDLFLKNTDLREKYLKFIDSVKRLNLLISPYLIREDTTALQIKRKEKELHALKQKKENLWKIDMREVGKVDVEKRKKEIEEEEHKLDEELEKVKKELKEVKAIYLHIFKGVNSRNLRMGKKLIQELGFYVS